MGQHHYLTSLGFLDGWAGNEKCLARILAGTGGIPLNTDQIIYYYGSYALRDAILNGEVRL